MPEPAQNAQGVEREGLRAERAQRLAQRIPEERRVSFEEVVKRPRTFRDPPAGIEVLELVVVEASRRAQSASSRSKRRRLLTGCRV